MNSLSVTVAQARLLGFTSLPSTILTPEIEGLHPPLVTATSPYHCCRKESTAPSWRRMALSRCLEERQLFCPADSPVRRRFHRCMCKGTREASSPRFASVGAGPKGGPLPATAQPPGVHTASPLWRRQRVAIYRLTVPRYLRTL
jgi:hypothetical protein